MRDREKTKHVGKEPKQPCGYIFRCRAYAHLHRSWDETNHPRDNETDKSCFWRPPNPQGNQAHSYQEETSTVNCCPSAMPVFDGEQYNNHVTRRVPNVQPEHLTISCAIHIGTHTYHEYEPDSPRHASWRCFAFHDRDNIGQEAKQCDEGRHLHHPIRKHFYSFLFKERRECDWRKVCTPPSSHVRLFGFSRSIERILPVKCGRVPTLSLPVPMHHNRSSRFRAVGKRRLSFRQTKPPLA